MHGKSFPKRKLLPFYLSQKLQKQQDFSNFAEVKITAFVERLVNLKIKNDTNSSQA